MSALPLRLDYFLKKWKAHKKNGKIILNYREGELEIIEIREIKRIADFERIEKEVQHE